MVPSSPIALTGVNVSLLTSIFTGSRLSPTSAFTSMTWMLPSVSNAFTSYALPALSRALMSSVRPWGWIALTFQATSSAPADDGAKSRNAVSATSGSPQVRFTAVPPGEGRVRRQAPALDGEAPVEDAVESQGAESYARR